MGSPIISWPMATSYFTGSPSAVRDVSYSITGTKGSTTYFYWVVATYSWGSVAPRAPLIVANGPDVLGVTGSVVLSWLQPSTQIVNYTVLRSTTNQFPGSSTTAVATAITATTVTDTGAALTAFVFTAIPAMKGGIFIDGTGPTPILVSSIGFQASSVTFGDGTTQTTAGASPYNWTQNVQSNGNQLLGLTGLTVNNPSAITTVAVQSGTAVSQFIISATAVPGSYGFIVNSGIFFLSDQNAPTPNNRIIIPSGNPGHIGLTTGASFTPGHLLELNTDDAAKPTTTTWITTSDIRTKRNVKRLEGGLKIIEKLEPTESEYNGLANTPNGSRIVSFDPDNLATVLPHSVSTHRAKLHKDDEEETDIRGVTTHETIFHLVLAVQQLAHQVKKLEERRH